MHFFNGFNDELTKLGFNWAKFNEVLQSMVIPAMVTGGLGSGLGLMGDSEHRGRNVALGGTVGTALGLMPGGLYHAFHNYPELWEHLLTAAKTVPAATVGAGLGGSIARLTSDEEDATGRTLLGSGIGAALLGIPGYIGIKKGGW